MKIFQYFCIFFLNKKILKYKTTKNKNKTCPQTIERIKSGTNKTRLKIKYFCLFENFSMFLYFFLNKKHSKRNKTTKNKNKTCPQTIEIIKLGTSQQHSP